MARRARFVGVALAVLASCSSGEGGDPVPAGGGPPPPGPGGGPDTLVLYDGDDPTQFGEMCAIMAGHLASRFGTWQARPVASYEAGELRRSRAAVYVGSAEGTVPPQAFLEDVLAGGTPVVWLGGNLRDLEQAAPGFAERYGFSAAGADASPIAAVWYPLDSTRKQPLKRYDEGPLERCAVSDAGRATVLAWAEPLGSEPLPWAIRSGDLTYIAEIPFAYQTEGDRSLAFADLLFDALAPETTERHRALVRIEDVTPVDDPARLRAIADVLSARGAPFSVAVVPVYFDPLGAYNGGQPELIRLRDDAAAGVVDALAYMIARGGALVLHGYTHQYGYEVNPYSGASADDFEFWMAHVDAENRVILEGPVPIDSESYARELVLAGLEELAAAGLPEPVAFEYPHYFGSAVDSRAIAAIVPTAYHRGLYFAGTLSGAEDLNAWFGQIVPYPVTDVYGWRVLPENLGNYQPVAYNEGVETRGVEDLVRNAELNLAVRDGFASFYFHPFFEPEILASIVVGIQGLGYEFVSAGGL